MAGGYDVDYVHLSYFQIYHFSNQFPRMTKIDLVPRLFHSSKLISLIWVCTGRISAVSRKVSSTGTRSLSSQMPTPRLSIQGCSTDFAYDAEHYVVYFYRQKTASLCLMCVDFVGVATPDPMMCLKARTWTVRASSTKTTTDTIWSDSKTHGN